MKVEIPRAKLRGMCRVGHMYVVNNRGSKSDLHSDVLIAWQLILTCSNALVNCGNPAVTSHCASHSPSRRTQENFFINYGVERSYNECRSLDMQKITQIIDVRQGRRIILSTMIAISPRLHAAAVGESISGGRRMVVFERNRTVRKAMTVLNSRSLRHKFVQSVQIKILNRRSRVIIYPSRSAFKAIPVSTF